jgi:PKD repeat protein
MTAGVVSLMLQKNPSLTPEQVKYILTRTAKPLGSTQPNNDYGWGRVWANYSVDNSSYCKVSFNISSYYVNEDTGTVTVNITKTGNDLFPASVHYATADGTAHNGVNYVAKSGTLTFQPADKFKTFTVNIYDDNVFDAQKYFTVSLSSPANATLGSNISSNIYINDTDVLADFMSNVTSGTSPLDIQFNDTSIGSITSWQWNFDDGTGNSTIRNATHTFINAGPNTATYTVTLTSSNATGSSTKQIVNYITVKPQPPVANFESDITSGIEPLTVHFTDKSTGTVKSWQWNFGDGTDNSTEHNPVHVFSNYGKYNVTLTVANDGGSSTRYVKDCVVVHNTTPVVNFNANITSGNAPLAIQFYDTSSGNNVTSWQWDFGDGTLNSTERNPVHVFNSYGKYPVTLTVKNDGGSSTKRMTNYILVRNATPSGNFNANITVGEYPLAIQFDDISTGNNITEWQWDFGDSSAISTDSHPVHVYTAKGVYDVKLTVKNDGGSNTVTRVRYINVTEPDKATFNVSLNAGWNLISFPVLPEDKSIIHLIPDDVRSHIFVIWSYTGAGAWKYWTELPDYTSTMSEVDTQHGYLVWCDSPVSFNVTGEMPDSDEVSLVSGDYNIIGYPKLDPADPADRYSDTLVVWGYKNGNWLYYTTLPGYTNTLTSLEPGYGYEVYK